MTGSTTNRSYHFCDFEDTQVDVTKFDWLAIQIQHKIDKTINVANFVVLANSQGKLLNVYTDKTIFCRLDWSQFHSTTNIQSKQTDRWTVCVYGNLDTE